MKLPLRNLILLVLMLAASGMAVALRPAKKIADQNASMDLQNTIPKVFGEWREERLSSVQIVDPEERELLNTIYSQTLSRTYVNEKRYRVMLSLAYGGDQSRDMQVHRPEVCYAAQGFTVATGKKVELRYNGLLIPAMQLETQLNTRSEPVTYWIRVGSRLVRGNIELGLARVFYGVQGQIADGLLFRVSSIDADASNGHRQQEKFIGDLIAAMPQGDRSAVLGDVGR